MSRKVRFIGGVLFALLLLYLINPYLAVLSIFGLCVLGTALSKTSLKTSRY